MALADAAIASWDAKFTYWQWRPVTAIPRAAEDGNPATAPDPSWTPLLTTPPFPDYIAGHTTYAGAAAAVLEDIFGRRPGVPLTMTSPSLPGVVLTYDTFAENRAGRGRCARVGRIHWRTSTVRGLQVGRRVGREAVRHFCTRARCRAPSHLTETVPSRTLPRVPITQDELETYEHKLRKRGFRRDDVLLHECPDCAAKAVLTYVIAGRSGGRDIRLCVECGAAHSWRSIAGLESRQEDPSFDLEVFLR